MVQTSGKLMQKILTPGVCLERQDIWPHPSPEDEPLAAWSCVLERLVRIHYLLDCCTWRQTMTVAAADDGMLVMGRRPGTAQGLEAAKEASDLGYSSRSSIALGDMMSNR